MITYNLTFTLLLLLLFIFIIFAKSSIETTETTESNNECSCPTEKIFDSNVEDGEFKSPGFPDKYCAFLDCKWNIQPAENTYIFARVESFRTEAKYDILDFYQTRWNASKLIKVKQYSLSGEKNQNPTNLLSSINGGLYFNFVTNGINHNFRGFKISFSRKSEGVNNYQFPCPQPFYFATNSLQRLPAFRLGFLDTCIFSINSTKAVKLTINRVNTDSVFGIKVFETESFPNRYENDQEGQLANSSFNSYPLIVKSRTESVSVLISSYEYDAEIVQVPYKIEFIAVENAQNEDFLQNHHSSTKLPSQQQPSTEFYSTKLPSDNNFTTINLLFSHIFILILYLIIGVLLFIIFFSNSTINKRLAILENKIFNKNEGQDEAIEKSCLDNKTSEQL
uniref:CUB domain-containing protein n=1 Tax=Meloidogyne incognita TaxID=6306 RepID=A0A914L773_MELIC